MNIAKFVLALGSCQSTITRNNQPNYCMHNGGEIREDARPSGNAGGAVFYPSGGDRVVGGGRIYNKIEALIKLINCSQFTYLNFE